MLNTLVGPEDRVTTAHRAKLAYIYVRQSTAGQVRQHQESTELQYRLVDRATVFGWPRERIEVIDDDLGKSGATSDGRCGFQRLIAEIGLGKAGLVLRLPLPVGLAYGRDGRVNLNPDEEVQARLLLLFAKFRELRSAKAVMRYLQQAGLRVPVRPLRGPAPQEVVWQPADSARVLLV